MVLEILNCQQKTIKKLMMYKLTLQTSSICEIVGCLRAASFLVKPSSLTRSNPSATAERPWSPVRGPPGSWYGNSSGSNHRRCASWANLRADSWRMATCIRHAVDPARSAKNRRTSLLQLLRTEKMKIVNLCKLIVIKGFTLYPKHAGLSSVSGLKSTTTHQLPPLHCFRCFSHMFIMF